MRSWLGLDIGTSAVKAVLVDDGRRVLAEASHAYPTVRPRPLWSEQDADLWPAAVETVVAAIAARAADAWAGLAGIGLSGQMHGAVLLGADDRPLRPVILWNDGRSHAEAAELAADPSLAEELGVLAMPGFTAPKLVWLARHEPQVMAGLKTLLLPKDYVRLHLTGTLATDPSDAAGAWLLDEAARAWSPRALAAAGLRRDQVPPIVEGSAPSGTLRSDVARRWGVSASVVVAGGAGDAAAGAVGIGAVEEGRAFLSLGTSAQLFAATAAYRPAIAPLVHSFCHAVPDRWFQMGAMLNGASAVGWLAGVLGADEATLSAAAEAAFSGPADVLFLPYLTGERTPLNDPHARGVFFGLTPATRRETLVQAVLEGVAFTCADAHDALDAAGTRIGELGFIGGGARNPFWARLLASVLDRTILVYAGADKGPAFGAACLGRMAVTGEPPAAVATVPAVERVFAPDPALTAAYAPRLARFRALYRALKPEFARAVA
jgi:xylulokinase